MKRTRLKKGLLAGLILLLALVLLAQAPLRVRRPREFFAALNGIRFADQFPGATVGAQIDACLADSNPNAGVCIVPPFMGAGAPTSVASNKFVWDLRGGGVSIGQWNNLRVVDGNKFTTIQAAHDSCLIFRGCTILVLDGDLTLTTDLIINRHVRIILFGSNLNLGTNQILVRGSTDIPGSSVEIVGIPNFVVGAGSSITYSGTAAAIDVGDGTNPIFRPVLRGFRLVAAGDATTSATARGIRFRDARYHLVDTVSIQGFGGGVGVEDTTGASFGATGRLNHLTVTGTFIGVRASTNHLFIDGGAYISSGGVGSICFDITSTAATTQIAYLDCESAETGAVVAGDQTNLTDVRFEFNTSTNISISATADRTTITNPRFIGGPITNLSDSGVRTIILGLEPLDLASLGTFPNGSTRYCTDCLRNSAPCTGVSTGSLARRENGAWNCD